MPDDVWLDASGRWMMSFAVPVDTDEEMLLFSIVLSDGRNAQVASSLRLRRNEAGEVLVLGISDVPRRS